MNETVKLKRGLTGTRWDEGELNREVEDLVDELRTRIREELEDMNRGVLLGSRLRRFILEVAAEEVGCLLEQEASEARIRGES